MRLISRIALGAALGSAALSAPLAAQNRYVIHNDPWGVGSTTTARWDQTFGAGNYTYNDYATAASNVAGIFSNTTRLVWLDGGASTDFAMDGFLNGNRPTIENWVASGGRLVLNAAPWNIGMNYGFGGIALTFDGSYSSASNSATAVNGTHPIFQGPFSPVGTSFSGGYFSHAFVSGGGISSIINDSQGRSVLADKNWGNGYLMVGGMTNSFFHSPNPEAANLASNILNYADQTSTVPEPGTYALMAAGLAGVAFAGRRRRRRAAVAS